MIAGWEGHFRESPAASPIEAKTQALPDVLRIDVSSRVYLWPYGEIRRKHKGYPGDPVILQRGDQPFPELVIYDPSFLSHLNEAVPALTRHLYKPGTLPGRVAFGLGVAGCLAGVIYFLVPLFASWLAPILPPSVEERIGSILVDNIAPESALCQSPSLNQAVEKITDRLCASSQPAPRLSVVVVREKVINAMALPGNRIVIYTGLIQKTRTPEELAGVLAHEIEHVVNRHVMKSWLQQLSSRLILYALVGRLSGPITSLYQSTGSMMILHYSRDFEEEADVKGMHRLEASHIDPHGMVTFFETLQSDGDTPELLTYFLTHPSTRSRIRQLRDIADKTPGPFEKLLPDLDWTTIRTQCS